MKINPGSPLPKRPFKFLKDLILVIAFIFSFVRLINHLYDFSLNSVQVDFSAYYTAGEALNHGLSPYDNNIRHIPPVWDGINGYLHSRFLYPPLVASLFQPIALIPYAYAKIIWSIFSLSSIILALYITSRTFSINRLDEVLICGICVCLYYPLITHLERGQIDAITLLLLTGSIYYMNQEQRSKVKISGLLIAFTVLLKLHTIYIIPFLFIRKRWQVLKWFFMGISVIILGSMAGNNGTSNLKDYVFNEMPRIANYGQPDHGDTLFGLDLIHTMVKDLPDGHTIKDGHIYQAAVLVFVGNATFARPLHDDLVLSGWNINHTTLSLIIFGVMCLTFLMWQINFFQIDAPSRAKDFYYWQAVIAVILLSAPLTHVMNTVWLLPVFVALISSYKGLHAATQWLGFGLVLSGMIFIGIPDAINLDVVFSNAGRLMNDKYLIGESLVLIGCLIFLSKKRSRSDQETRLA